MTTAIGWRIWDVDDDGRLRSGFVHGQRRQWETATEVAACRNNPSHQPPEPTCHCGLHFWTDRELCIIQAEARQAPVIGAVLVGARILPDPEWPSAYTRRTDRLTIIRLWARPESYDKITPPAGVPLVRDYLRLADPVFMRRWYAATKDTFADDSRDLRQGWEEVRAMRAAFRVREGL